MITLVQKLLIVELKKCSHTGHSDPRCCGRKRAPRSGDGNHNHFCTRVHRLRNRCRPQEGFIGHNCSYRNRFHCRSKHSSCRSLQRWLHEPSSLLWSCCGSWKLCRQLDLLGRTTDRWWPRRVHLRRCVHYILPTSCSGVSLN